MFTPVNPEAERIRAQSILRSFTEHQAAVNLFAPGSVTGDADEREANRDNEQSIMRVFKAIKRNRRPAADKTLQQPAYPARQITTSGCS